MLFISINRAFVYDNKCLYFVLYPLGIIIFCNDQQYANTLSPMFVTFEGISISFNKLQLLNALSPIVVTFEGISIFCKVEPLKALLPMTVTLCGILN